MSDKVKFHNMTKPMKFRRLKMVKQVTVLWCKALRERIIYHFNYLLYKLNILKRYSYRDNVEQVIPAPHEIREKSVKSKYFGGDVIMQLVSSKDIDIDYFYYEKKEGSKKITLYLKDHFDSKLFVDSHLENIHIKVGDQWYNVDHLPIFKVDSIVEPEPVAPCMNMEYIERPVESKIVEYDIMKLKTLHHRLLVGHMSPSDISVVMYKYYYGCACHELEKHLYRLTLADIMR